MKPAPGVSKSSSPLLLAVKRLALALVAVASLSALPARAAEYGPNLILVNPGDLLFGVVSLEYERALNPWFGLTAGISVAAFPGVPLGTPFFAGINPEFGLKFHFIRDAPGGLWFGPTVSAGYLFERPDRPWTWGLGAGIGYNFIFGRHFTFQLGAGGGFTDYGDRLVWSPRLKLGLGAAF